MIEQAWRSQNSKILICLDSYSNGVPRGWIYSAYHEADPFESLSQFLLKLEALLEARNMPQAYTTPRTFLSVMEEMERRELPPLIRKGAKATFELQILFRQHTSWQGVITWLDRNVEQSFRSVLELVVLMDSALRSTEGCGGIS